MSDEEKMDVKLGNDDDPSESSKLVFKRKGKRNLRRRVKSDDSDDSADEEVRSKLGDLKGMQNLRKRPHGVSLMSLAIGKKTTFEEDSVADDPFGVHSGGMVNMQAIKSGKLKVDDAYDTGIGTQFSVETNKRDEDEEMMKYIEQQLSKRKGNTTGHNFQNVPAGAEKIKYCSPEEAALQAVPTHLRESSTKRSEEMLSNQMLSGIPEVDLGIEAKIKNIEATEEAKLRLMWEKHNKKDGPSQFVPSNMAVNFVQHSRFNIDDTPKSKQKAQAQTAHVQEERTKSKKDEKATDDYHYERFKKQFRKY